MSHPYGYIIMKLPRFSLMSFRTSPACSMYDVEQNMGGSDNDLRKERLVGEVEDADFGPKPLILFSVNDSMLSCLIR